MNEEKPQEKRTMPPEVEKLKAQVEARNKVIEEEKAAKPVQVVYDPNKAIPQAVEAFAKISEHKVLENLVSCLIRQCAFTPKELEVLGAFDPETQKWRFIGISDKYTPEQLTIIDNKICSKLNEVESTMYKLHIIEESNKYRKELKDKFFG